MMTFFCVIKPNRRRKIALLENRKGFENRIKFMGFGYVDKPIELNNIKQANPFKWGDMIFVIDGVVKSDFKNYPWLFTKGEFCRVLKKPTIEVDDEGNESISIPGIKIADFNIPIIQVLFNTI
jgi:hypothetical protein